MVRSRGRGGFRPRMTGVRTAWRTIDDGEFFCTGCGGDRSYQLLAGRRRLTVLGVPLLPRGPAEPVVACAACHGHFPVADLDRPTTTRLAALLRDAVHTVALALLSAGDGDGGDGEAARRAAVESVRAAGFPECTEERLLTLQAALWGGQSHGPIHAPPAGVPPAGVPSRHRPVLDPESREVLVALAPHLAATGREALLLHGARVALADGPYRPAEQTVLVAIGAALRLHPADTSRLLTEAAAASGA